MPSDPRPVELQFDYLKRKLKATGVRDVMFGDTQRKGFSRCVQCSQWVRATELYVYSATGLVAGCTPCVKGAH